MQTSEKKGPFILLQGPVSGFFGAFSRHVEKNFGTRVLKIDFNLGDVLSDHCADRISYRGMIEDLDDWYGKLFAEHDPRAIVVFGDERPVHVIARRVCKRHDIPFFSFEEGYVRPDFVTLERGGNNANSTLPRQPDLLVERERPTDLRHFGRNFTPMALHAIKYYCMFWAGRRSFTNNVHHRNQSLRFEIISWIKAFAQKIRWKRYENRLSEKYSAENSGKYFIVALQKYDDAQLTSHGRGWNAERVITDVLASFAAHAPADCRLVVKQHPLNTGYRDFSAQIEEATLRNGLGDRLLYLQNGNQLDLLAHARGLVTINSTMGLAALGYGCSVLTLGDAFYAMPGLAVDGAEPATLDRFWADPPPVDAELFHRFQSHVIAETQLNGDFYIRRAWPGLCDAAFRRLSERS
jgi:capsular polysaccharide export protein